MEPGKDGVEEHAGPAEQTGHGRSTDPVVRVVVIEDHVLVAETLRLALADVGIEAVLLGPDASLPESLERIRPHVVVIDLELGASVRRAGLGLIPIAVSSGSEVIVLTGVRDREDLGAAIAAGASGVVGKHEPVELLVDKIRRAARGEQVTTPDEREALLQDLVLRRLEKSRQLRPFLALTHREAEVLAMMCAGRSPAEIAKQTFVSLATARGHINSVLHKLGVRSQLAAVAKARRAGWGGLTEGD